MTVEGRPDPVEIFARVGDVNPGIGGSARAFEVWTYHVRKAGWEVLNEPGFISHADGTLCGEVEIEGLRYQVHYGPRIRGVGLDDRTSPPSWRPVLHFAAWAEPKLERYRLD